MAPRATRSTPRPATSRDLRVRSQLVGPVLQAVARAGGDAAALMRDFGLPPTALTDPEVVLPLTALQAFFDAAERAADDPMLGVHVAERSPRGQFGALEYAARSAPNLREALGRVARYIALLNENVVITFTIDGGEGVITQRVPGRPLCLGRHGNEFFAASVLTQARLATGRHLVPTRVFFAHPAPRSRAALERFFGTAQLAFDAEHNGLGVTTADLDLPLVSHDPALLALVDTFAARELGDRGAPAGSGLLGQVRAAVRTALREGPPSLDDVARGLKMSPRSLQRRLADDGTSFQDLVEAVRQELARTWVTEGGRAIGEIAFLLGYSELGAFVRAFRRWTGTTPAAYRARAASAG